MAVNDPLALTRPQDAIKRLCEGRKERIREEEIQSPKRLYGVSTFYSYICYVTDKCISVLCYIKIHKLHLRGNEFSGILCPFFTPYLFLAELRAVTHARLLGAGRILGEKVPLRADKHLQWF